MRLIDEICADIRKAVDKIESVELEIGKAYGLPHQIDRLIQAENLLTYCRSRLSDIDPADLVPRGRWNGEGDGYADGEIVLDVWYCSECNHCIDDGTDEPCLLPKFCPNCGADMRERADEGIGPYEVTGGAEDG